MVEGGDDKNQPIYQFYQLFRYQPFVHPLIVFQILCGLFFELILISSHISHLSSSPSSLSSLFSFTHHLPSLPSLSSSTIPLHHLGMFLNQTLDLKILEGGISHDLSHLSHIFSLSSLILYHLSHHLISSRSTISSFSHSLFYSWKWRVCDGRRVRW